MGSETARLLIEQITNPAAKSIMPSSSNEKALIGGGERPAARLDSTL
jgi:hypothetical protein